MRSRGVLRVMCRLVLGLYPGAWRARYGPEIEDVLDHHQLSASTVLDLTAGALDAHRHPELADTEALPMSARLRSSLRSALLVTVVFALAWAEVLNVRVRNPGIWIRAYPQGADLAIKFVGLAAAVGLAAIMTGALLFLASAHLRRGQPRRGVLVALAGMLPAFAAFVGLFAAAATAIDSNAGGSLWPVALLGWAVVSVGVARAVAHTSPNPGVFRPCVMLIRIGVSAMAFAVVGSVWLGVALSVEAPAIDYPILPVILMAVAGVWAAASLRRLGGEGQSQQRVV